MKLIKIAAKRSGDFYIGVNDLDQVTCVINCTAYDDKPERGLKMAETILAGCGPKPMSRETLERALEAQAHEPAVAHFLLAHLELLDG